MWYYAVTNITPKTYYVQLGYSQSCLCYSLYMAAWNKKKQTQNSKDNRLLNNVIQWFSLMHATISMIGNDTKYLFTL